MLQLLTLGVALALLHNENFLDRRLWNVLIAVTTITTVASGLQYLYLELLSGRVLRQPSLKLR